MKTPEEIIQLYPALCTLDDRGIDVKKTALNLAFKEYAKQWVEKALGESYEGSNITWLIEEYQRQIEAQ